MDPRIEQLKELAGLFESNYAQYKSSNYDEANTRTDFIDKFFTLLDWDIANSQGFSEVYREVVREDKVTIDGSQKAPDYSFRIGGFRKYFVEAKKPSVNIKDAAEPAFQVRRYAYTAKLPLSILTNFAEFAMYDTRIKPNKNDNAGTARIFYCTYKEYETHFDFIYNIFSKSSILKGSFDKYVEDNKNKKGTSEVDDDLLSLIEEWRVELAKNIALRNPALSIYNLNTAVQKIIDRIIFLRIAEDKGIEDENLLLTAAKTNNIYEKLILLFKKADVKYNSGLFLNIDWIDTLSIDNKVLSHIIVNLYYPECPYEFSVLPVEILGSIYERFLGKTIRFKGVKGGHTAIIEEKPEVKKAGGVFYTPQYIVDYITQNTVGEKIKGRTPEEIAAIKICDPACGSGSFLVGAYQYLLQYHLDYYTQKENIKAALKKEKIYEADFHSCRLTISEKQRILTNNIFGVDIDGQAVEVTKLSLYLKLLENEGKEAGERLFKYSDLTLLPSLEENIKCGNSLIGTDFYAQGNFDLDDDARIKVNCFDWKREFKPRITQMNANEEGLFDVVIGNPPYTYLIPDMIQTYFQKTYKYQDYQKDLYLIFLEKYHSLLKESGVFGIIVSNTWLLSVTYKKIRTYLTSNYRWHKILHLPEKVFDAVVDTHILIFEKNMPDDSDICEVEIYKNKTVTLLHKLPFAVLPKDGTPINVIVNPQKRSVFDRIVKECRQLENYCNVYNGVKPFEKGKGTPPQTERIMKEKPYVVGGTKPGPDWSPLLRGSLIHRYTNRWNNNYWIKYGEWLAAPRDSTIFIAPEKIVVRQTGDSLIATYIKNGIICRDNLHLIINNSDINVFLFLALLNSKLLNFVYEIINPEKGEALAQVKKRHIEQLPIPTLDLSNKTDKAAHDNLVSLVDKMLKLKQKEAAEPNQQLKTMITRQIESVDKAIDMAVYALYGLTADEIKTVEKGE
jgi:adenine-specific DNA-methyltransferase